jgi:signal transduction histidine kinase
VAKKSIFIGWIPLVVGVWAVIFGAYEIIERTLLENPAPDLLHLLHIARGTLTSFLVAAVVAWYIIRKGRVESLREEIKSPSPDLQSLISNAIEVELEKRLGWLIRLRWVAIGCVFVTIGVTSAIFKVLSTYSVFALILITVAMMGYNLVFSFVVKKVHVPRAHAFAQVLLDLISLTLMLHFSGGIENPFFAFFVFHVIIGSILLRKHEAYLVGICTCLLFCGMVILEHTGVLNHYALVTDHNLWPQLLALTVSPYYVPGILFAFVATTLFSVYFTTTIMENLWQRQFELQTTGELLAQEKRKLDDIVRSIGAGLLVADRKHKIVWSNEKVKEWFGPVEVGQYCYLQCCKCSGVPDECPTHGVFEYGRVSNWERVVEAGGERRFFMVTATPIKDTRGEITHVLALIQDITRMKEVEIQLVQAGKMVAVGQLASGIAHEINNPLATVAASAELLNELAQQETLARLKEFESFPRHLKRIEGQVYRCKEIIQSLLGFARIEDVGFVDVRVNDVLADTLKLIRESAVARGQEIICLHEGELPPVQANPRQLQQVFLNILMNALDAIDGGGRVTVRTFLEGQNVVAEIEDNGKGIPPEHLPKIFDPFFTTKPPGKGTGLGLYLVHQIMQSQKGNVTVSSEAGKGSIFKVFIPRR